MRVNQVEQVVLPSRLEFYFCAWKINESFPTSSIRGYSIRCVSTNGFPVTVLCDLAFSWVIIYRFFHLNFEYLFLYGLLQNILTFQSELEIMKKGNNLGTIYVSLTVLLAFRWKQSTSDLGQISVTCILFCARRLSAFS